MQDNTLTRAGFGPRAAAFLLDRLLLWIALCVVRVPAYIASLFGGSAFTMRAFLFQYSAPDVLCWLLSAVYFTLMTYYTGATLGKKVMRLRVESESGESLRLLDVLYRETVGRFLSGILCIGYLLALADRDHRALHDRLCDTRVVYDDVRFSKKPQKPAPVYTAPGAAEAGGLSAPEAPAPIYSIPGRTANVPSEPKTESENG